MRWREFLIPTSKETPKDAAVPSHVLMLRAGLIRPVMTGVHSYLPLGWRVLRKVERVIREEMERAGAIELHTAVLQPLAWWRQSGRAAELRDALLRLSGPPDDWRCQTVLGASHVEVVTEIAGAYLRSYKQLPVCLYRIQSGFHGEERPRRGVLCPRESLATEAYSFDANEAGLDESCQRMHDAYGRIFRRCGLPCLACEAERAPDAIAAHEFMMLAEAGEDRVALTDNGDYAANAKWAGSAEPPPAANVPLEPLKEVHTPGCGRVEDVCDFMGTTPAQMIKTLIYVGTEARRHEGTKGNEAAGAPAGRGEVAAGPRTGRSARGGIRVVSLVRGDHELNEHKLNKVAGLTLELADPRTIEELTGAHVGFAGPQGLAEKADKLIIDRHVAAMRNAASGANQTDYHVMGINPGRDFPLEGDNVFVADIRNVVDGDPSPTGGGSLRIKPAIEVGRVAKLGTTCSEAANATFLDKQGQRQPFVMGCYTINLDCVIAAAIEAHHDDNGIVWPMSIAPFQVLVLALDPRDEQVMKTASEIHDELDAVGIEVLLDDRDERAGFKFKDADLIGIPLRIIVGKKSLADGRVELSHRRDGAKHTYEPTAAIRQVVKLVNEELARLS